MVDLIGPDFYHTLIASLFLLSCAEVLRLCLVGYDSDQEGLASAVVCTA